MIIADYLAKIFLMFRLFLLLSAGALFGFYLYGSSDTASGYFAVSSIEKSIVFTNKIQNVLPMEAYYLDLNSDGRNDFIIGQLNQINIFKPSGFLFIEQREDGSFYDNTPNYITDLKTFHIRHVVQADFNRDGINDLFVADHGVDVRPFLGGQGQILIGSKTPPYFRNETASRIPAHKLFTFNSIAADFNNDNFIDIFLSNYLTKTGFPTVLINDGKGVFHFDKSLFAHSRLFPKSVEYAINCYMYSVFIDLDGDGVNELVAGACNRKGTKDAIFKIGPDGVGRKVKNALPDYLEEGWGSIYVSTKDMNMDGKLDIVTVTHNLDYDRGTINILYNKGNLNFEKSKFSFAIEFKPEHKFFIPNVILEDLNGDKRPDVLFALRDTSAGKAPPLKHYIHLFLNEGDEQFNNKTELFDNIQESPLSLSVDKDPKTGQNEILFLSFLGELQKIKLSF